MCNSIEKFHFDENGVIIVVSLLIHGPFKEKMIWKLIKGFILSIPGGFHIQSLQQFNNIIDYGQRYYIFCYEENEV